MPRIKSTYNEVQTAFLEFLREHALELGQQKFNPDGQIHRADAANKEGHSGRNDGSYSLHLDGDIPYGGCQNWTIETKWTNWHFKRDGKKLAADERRYLDRVYEEQRQRLKVEERKKRAEACKQAEAIWNKARNANSHPYCERKGIEPAKLRTVREM